MNAIPGHPGKMSAYEARRWDELVEHWTKKAEPRRHMPSWARAPLEQAAQKAKVAATVAGHAVADITPSIVKDGLQNAVDATLVPAVKGMVHLLELVTDWTTELMDPERVLEHHRLKGRAVESLEDLKAIDLIHLDEYTRTMALKWRTSGAAEGATMGLLATVPFAGGAAAISLDMVVMHVLSTAVVTRVAYSYGFDVTDEELGYLVDRMVVRAYKEQAPKAATARQANAAFAAGRGRVRWSQKLRDDHKLMAAVEKLMKQFANGRTVPVEKVTKAMPVVAIFAGAGMNAFVLGDVVHQARLYAQTLFLAEKHGLPLPVNLRGSED